MSRLLLPVSLILAAVLTVVISGILALPSQRPMLLFVSNEMGYDQIYALDVQRNQIRPVTREFDALGQNSAPAVTPDGKRIAFTSTSRTEFAQDIYITDFAGHEQKLIDTEGLAGLASWSPDGRQLLYHDVDDGVRLYVSDANGEHARLLSPEDAAAEVNHRWPRWSPDGSQIVFVSETGNWPGITNYAQIYLIESDGNGRRLLLDLSAGAASWSPDGQKIAVAAQYFYAEPSMIFIIDVNTGEAIQATPESLIAWEPIWSPDGRFITFLTPQGNRNETNLEIYLLDTEQGNQIYPLTTNSESRMYAMAWSPDGQYLAYTAGPPIRGTDQRTDLFLVETACATQQLERACPPRQVTFAETGVYHGSPVWMPQ